MGDLPVKFVNNEQQFMAHKIDGLDELITQIKKLNENLEKYNANN